MGTANEYKPHQKHVPPFADLKGDIQMLCSAGTGSL